MSSLFLKRFTAVFLDLDGVVCRGQQAVPGAVETINRLHGDGLRIRFLTNNASTAPAQVAEKLRELGVAEAAAESTIITSAQVACSALSGLVPGGARVLVVGSPSLADGLRGQGLKPVVAARGESLDAEVVELKNIAAEVTSGSIAAVVQGIDRSISWVDLAAATIAVRAGARWVVTNTDATLPTEFGDLPGNGSLVNVVRQTAGAVPALVAGKPEPLIFHAALRSCRAGASEALMVGDRLDTDIYGAQKVGIFAACVLTGVTGSDDLPSARRQPDLVLNTLADLYHRDASQKTS